VLEAVNPYSNYYGALPQQAQPNSLFMLTKKFHYLDEIISRAKWIEKCLLDKIDLASAVLEIKDKQYFAIRVKHFPDYKQLPHLQLCFQKSGIEFLPSQKINANVKAKINKLFTLQELEPNFYLDKKEDHKGYFLLDKPWNEELFEKRMKQTRNNTSCRLFDAVPGYFLMHSTTQPMVRVYSDKIDVPLLNCLRKEFSKQAMFAE
jgi:hypothetical protein